MELGNFLLHQLVGRSAKLLLLLAERLVQVAGASVQLSQASLGVGVYAQRFDAHLGNKVVEPRGPFRYTVHQRLLRSCGYERSEVAYDISLRGFRTSHTDLGLPFEPYATTCAYGTGRPG